MSPHAVAAGDGLMGEVWAWMDAVSHRVFHRALPAEVAALSVLRKGFERWLADLDWPAEQAADLVLALNEAVSNAVEHAYRRDRLVGSVAVRAELAVDPDGARRIVLEVADGGHWRPFPVDRGYRGRGLEMMGACTESLEIDVSPTGTTVHMLSHKVGAGHRPELGLRLAGHTPPG